MSLNVIWLFQTCQRVFKPNFKSKGISNVNFLQIGQFWWVDVYFWNNIRNLVFLRESLLNHTGFDCQHFTIRHPRKVIYRCPCCDSVQNLLNIRQFSAVTTLNIKDLFEKCVVVSVIRYHLKLNNNNQAFSNISVINLKWIVWNFYALWIAVK